MRFQSLILKSAFIHINKAVKTIMSSNILLPIMQHEVNKSLTIRVKGMNDQQIM